MTSRETIVREHLTLSGHLGADSVVPWILRYAAKLVLGVISADRRLMKLKGVASLGEPFER